MEFELKTAIPNEAPQLARLIREVWASMEQPDWFAIEDDDYLVQHMQAGKALAWKAIETGTQQTAGVCVAICPGMDTENLGHDIGLDTDALAYVAHMDTVAILPAYRGHRLQQRLVRMAEKELYARGYRYLLCTIHPDNLYSQHNMEKLGYARRTKVVKYGGLERWVYSKPRP